MLTRGERRLALAGLCFMASAIWTQCSPPTPKTTSPLLGDMTPIVSVKELMADMIDPLADNIFDAVWWEVTAKGVVDHRPRTDDEWQQVRTGAVTLAEGIYLLKVARPFAPPGDVNNSTGANPPELSPTQIEAKVAKDPVLWNAKIEALRNVGLATLEAVKRKDVDALFQAGADLDAACEACHLEYWYPGDKDGAPRAARAGDVRQTRSLAQDLSRLEKIADGGWRRFCARYCASPAMAARPNNPQGVERGTAESGPVGTNR
jgi:hypothetical protein